MADIRHALTKKESELARKLFQSIYGSKGGNTSMSDLRTAEVLGIMVHEFRKSFHYNDADEAEYFAKAIHGARMKPIVPNARCLFHSKRFCMRYFPEIRGYGTGWYCTKCGEFKHSPSMTHA